MATVIELRERAAKMAQEARAVKDKADAEGRTMTTDEVKLMRQHTAESKRVLQEAQDQQDLEEQEARLKEPLDKKSDLEVRDNAVISIEPNGPRLLRMGQLQAFKGAKADIEAYTSGQWVLAAIMGNAKSRQWCHDHGVEVRVQTEGINSAGGFVVPDVMERAVIDLRESYGVFRQQCRVIPMSSDHVNIPRRSGGVTAYFPGETTEITASDKSWNNVELTARKLAALTRMSSDLAEDAIINVADDLAQEMAYAFATKEDQCGIDGDGTSTYGGVVGIRTKLIDGNHAGGYYDVSTGADTWSEITDAQLISVMAICPGYARANAKWFCSPVAKSLVFDRLMSAKGGVTIAETAAGAPARYMGAPIVEMCAMPSSMGTTALNNVIAILFGDMRQSTTLGNRRGLTVIVSRERYMEYDQIGIQATERFALVNHDLGSASAAGPLVGLLGGS